MSSTSSSDCPAERDQTATDSPERLLDRLTEAGDRTAAQVAVLWTWLERNRRALGSLGVQQEQLIERALDEPPFTELTPAHRELIERAPVPAAAQILAGIALRQTSVNWAPNVTSARGVDGEEVLVRWRNPALAGAMNDVGGGAPPAAQQVPSLAAIAPRLSVSPRVIDGLRLQVHYPSGTGWEAAAAYLDQAMLNGVLDVHLDPLVNATAPAEEDPEARFDPPLLSGSTGWRARDGFALLLDEQIDASDHASCIDAVTAAVREASGHHSLLVLPELVATAGVVDAIAAEIRAQELPPALTVVGLRHRPGAAVRIDPALVGGDRLAEHVNEAVVLGPDGEELWRHRKLTRAGAPMPSGADGEVKTAFERINLGDTITIVESPLGTAAVAICLDVFETGSRERLARSPIELLLVPSLSPHVNRHRASLVQMVQELWGVAFVCNRGFRPDARRPTGWREEETRSFWAVQRDGQIEAPLPLQGDHRALVCRVRPRDEEE